MTPISLPPIDLLESLLTIDRETGDLRWRERGRASFSSKRACSTWNARFAGKSAGSIDPLGYVRVCIKREGERTRNYLAHRIVYFMTTGEQPETIDHIDGNPKNNSPGNLRAATLSQNGCNKGPHRDSRTGVKGVDIRDGRYRARIRKDGNQRYLGMFATIEEARAAYNRAVKEIHGTYAKES